MSELTDFHGPLGALAPELQRRRIAVATDDHGAPVLVRPDSVVIDVADDDDARAEVAHQIEDRGLEVLGRGDQGVPAGGLLGARRRPTERPPERWSVRPAQELLADLRDTGLPVELNHVYLADGVARRLSQLTDTGSSGTPGRSAPRTRASAARPAPPIRLPDRLDLAGRARPDVLVLDTGLALDGDSVAHPELRDHCVVHQPWRRVNTAGRWDDDDEPDDDGLGHLDDQAGHGTFISGILRRTCPDARIHHRGVLTSYGDGDDASVVAAVARALRAQSYDVVVMAFGCYAAEDRPTPMTRAIRRLLDQSVVVASAGNDGSSRPAYPAALPGVVAVGALDGNERAGFSNFGPWVDACAPGADVTSTFFDFDDAAVEGFPAQHFRGWATWSGTSFAAPLVAGAIAREQYLWGGSARDAWARVQSRATTRVPDLGVVVTD